MLVGITERPPNGWFEILIDISRAPNNCREIIRDTLACYIAGDKICGDAMVLADLRSPCEKVPGKEANSPARHDESVHSTSKTQQRIAETK